MKIKKEHLVLMCIFLIGVIARIIKFKDSSLEMDFVAFSRLGKNLIESGRYVFGENYNVGVFFPPGYPIFIGLTDLLVNDLFVSTKLVSLFASCITILLSYFIGKELYNKESGLFAAFVYALYPVILIISVDGYSDALFFCFLTFSLYLFIISAKKDNFLIHALLGISFAMAYLTRPEGLFLLLLPFLQLLGVFTPLEREPHPSFLTGLTEKLHFNKKYLLKIFVVYSVFFLVISPYMLFLKDYTGKFGLSGKSDTSILLGELSGDKGYHEIVNAPDNLYDKAAFTLTEDKTQLTGWDRKANASLKDYILKDPVNLLKRYQKNILQEIKTLTKLIIPIILPLFFSFFNRELFRNRMSLIFIILPSIFFLLYPLFIIIEKQTLLIILFLILFSSGGFANSQSAVSELANYYSIKKNKIQQLLEKNIKYLIVIILILSSLSYLKYSSFDKSSNPAEHERTGYYLKKYVSREYEKLNVMSRKPYVSFYSDSRFTMLPYANSTDVINFAKLYSVDYIVIDERALGKWEYYDELIKMDKYSNDVELVYENSSEKLIKLFRVKR